MTIEAAEYDDEAQDALDFLNEEIRSWKYRGGPAKHGVVIKFKRVPIDGRAMVNDATVEMWAVAGHDVSGKVIHQLAMRALIERIKAGG